MAIAGPAMAAPSAEVFAHDLTVPLAGPASASSLEVVGWGPNDAGQLGDGNRESSDVPVSASGLKGVTALVGGSSFSLALLEDGTVMSWGYDGNGQLGPREPGRPDTVPGSVGGLSGVTAISAGQSDALALLGNGTVMAWGEGPLGNGHIEESAHVPVAVSGLSGVTAISDCRGYSVALLNNGTVEAWGDNRWGELGDGTTNESPVPVPVSSLSGVAAIACSESNGFALLNDGTVRAWGAGGGLGNGTSTQSDVPVPVSGLSGVTAISGGQDQALALLGSGTVMAWGSNVAGALGNGTTGGESLVPEAVSGLSGVTAVAAGFQFGLARLANGTVKSWGAGQEGQLGDGSNTNSDVPVVVSSLREATIVSAGWTNGLAYGALPSSPTVTRLEPSAGPAGGGTSVTITGTNLAGATAVKFGASAAESFTVSSESSITALSPPGSGVADVTVSTPEGTSPTSSADRFSYEPTVTGVQPNYGPASGGTSVTITGSNFTGATAVRFGATDAKSFTVNSATSITALSPAGTGQVTVTVTTPGGTSAPEYPFFEQFNYEPIVNAVQPRQGPAAGGTAVEVRGMNFTGATAVSFEGAGPATSFHVESDTTILAVSPRFAGSSASVPVRVTTPGGVSSTTSHSSILPEFYFRYAPTITGIAPKSGPPAGGTSVRISGTGFSSVHGPDEFGAFVRAVRFGSTAATSFSVSENQFREIEVIAMSPPGTGTVDVAVETYGGTSPITSADQFTYSGPVPAVTNVEPSHGPAAGGANVTITGTNLAGATAVKFGSRNATGFVVNSESSITATSPPWTSGNAVAEVTVTTPGGTSRESIGDSFIYEPTVTKVEPNSGPAAGGTSVAVTGTGFQGVFTNGSGERPPFVTAVRFGAAKATSFTVESETKLSAVAPAGAGLVDVTVETEGVTSPTGAADRYTYTPAANTHWYQNLVRSEEGRRVPYISWGTLALTSSEGGASTECQSVAMGYVENPSGAAAGAFEREGAEVTEAFSPYNCTNAECEAAGGRAGVLAEHLPWTGMLSEEIKGTPRLASAGVRLFIHCRTASSPPTEQPGTGQYAGDEERRSLEYNLPGAATCTTGAGGAMMPKVLNGTSGGKPSKIGFAAGAASGELECAGAGKLATTGNLKIMGYEEGEVLSVKSP